MTDLEKLNKFAKTFARDFDENGHAIIRVPELYNIVRNAFLAGLSDGFECAEGRASGENYLVLERLDEDDKELSWECFLDETIEKGE